MEETSLLVLIEGTSLRQIWACKPLINRRVSSVRCVKISESPITRRAVVTGQSEVQLEPERKLVSASYIETGAHLLKAILNN